MSKKKKLKPQAVQSTGSEKRSIPPSVKQAGKTQLRFFSTKFLLFSGVLFFIVIILYAASFKYGYTYDDSAVVSQNRFVQKGMTGIGDILHTQYFEGYDPHTNAGAYRPVSLISYAIETELFGTGAKSHHVINVLIYALTGILLFYFLYRLLKNYHHSLPFIIA